MNNLNPKSLKLLQILSDAGIETVIKEFPQSTRTAQDAAEAIGCTLGQIAKSLIFKSESEDAVIVIASGTNRVDIKKIEALIGKKISKADADFVFQKTGFVIGGVPPFGHSAKLTTILDQDLEQYNEIWASAGTQHSVFKTSFINLLRLTDAKIADIKTD